MRADRHVVARSRPEPGRFAELAWRAARHCARAHAGIAAKHAIATRASPRGDTVRNIGLFVAVADPQNPRVPGLGDLISKNAFLRMLAEHHPSARRVFVAGPRLVRRYREYLLEHAYIDDVIEAPEMETASLRDWIVFLRRMRALHFDMCIIDPSSTGLGPIHAYFCGIPRRIGLSRDGFDTAVLTDVVEPPNSAPDLLDMILAYAQALGLPRPDGLRGLIPCFPYRRPSEPRPDLSIVAVHVGGDAHWNRRWPLASYCDLCTRFCRDARITLHLVGGASDWEESESVREHVLRQIPGARIQNCAGGTIDQLASRIDQAVLFVGNDSAPMHIAGALGKPVVVPCGPIGGELWQRLYRADAISVPSACRDFTPFSGQRHRERVRSCEQHGCPYEYDAGTPGYPRCLMAIPVDAVWKAASAHLPSDADADAP